MEKKKTNSQQHRVKYNAECYETAFDMFFNNSLIFYAKVKSHLFREINLYGLCVISFHV